jgi:two-component system phosphate regulon response regulator PhoB
MIKKTILVIDDEQDVLDVIRKRLENNEYKVITVSNGAKGLEAAAEKKPDLILLDIMMPGVDGLEVLRKIKLNRQISAIPVIMLTAKGESKTIFEAEDLGAADYIIKPYDETELIDLIRKYI